MRKLLVAVLAVLAIAAAPARAQSAGDGLADWVQVDQAFATPLLPPGIFAHVTARASEFFADGGKRVMFSSDLQAKLQAGAPVVVVDTRPKAEYEAGHIPGAINLEQAVLFRPENLSRLPADGTQIVVVCHTGHTASQVNAVLNVLGYNAWSLRFGMMGWRGTTAMKFGSSKEPDQLVNGFDGPVVLGANP